MANAKQQSPPPSIVKSFLVNIAYKVKVIVTPAVITAAVMTELAVYIAHIKATTKDSQRV